MKNCATIDQIPVKNNRNWDFQNLQLSNIFPAKHDHDCVVKEQALTIYYFDRKNTFDTKNKQIGLVNIAPGTLPNDAATLGQIVTCEKGVFKFGDFSKILVADPTLQSGLTTMDGEPYLPKNYVYIREEDDRLVSANNKLIVSTIDYDIILVKKKDD
jgi:hypothetical protein